MKVYVVMQGYAYEGHSPPEHVWSTRELAELEIQKIQEKTYRPDTLEIVEYEVETKPNQKSE